MTDELTFVDTNVLLYAYDRSAGARHATARRRLADLWASRTGVSSTQVLQEFYVNATRKLPKPLPVARARLVVSRYAAWPIHQIAPADILEASGLEQQEQLSFWDALILVAATRAGAASLLTEGLQHGRMIRSVRVTSPFAT
jgi:predicted nucleic acid-binding protein